MRFSSWRLISVCALACSSLEAQPPAHQPVGFETIFHFNPPDPSSAGWGSYLVSDGQGGFYGNIVDGGAVTCSNQFGCGSIYHLTQPAAPGGAWTKTTLYDFAGSPDGEGPYGPVVTGPGGVLYGVTNAGGGDGCGTVFSLIPPAVAGDAWTEAVLYSFLGNGLGCYPIELIAGSGGVLYGITSQGGNAGCGYFGEFCGVAFSLSPPAASGESWTESTIYSFSGDEYTATGSSLIQGPGGILYGTKGIAIDPCQNQECGAVFSLTPPATDGDAWTETILHQFTGWPDDGNSPNGVTLGPHGELYGTTYLGEGHPCGDKHAGCGTVFELQPSGDAWTETVLYTFPASPAPSHPQLGVVLGNNGELYGSTPFGGKPGCEDNFGCGAIFSLIPPASPGGAWTETILHYFADGADGAQPFAGMVLGKDGALYGTTQGYSTQSAWIGTVFLIRNP